jgi:hypothetical protein
MVSFNKRRVLIVALGGTIIWIAWTMLVNYSVLGRHYEVARAAGLMLRAPRYPAFFFFWIVTLFLLSYVIAWMYANLRATQGPGPKTALKLGLKLGFVAGFPLAFSSAAWSPLDRVLPLWWCLDLWVGACLSAIVSGWLYKEAKSAAGS